MHTLNTFERTECKSKYKKQHSKHNTCTRNAIQWLPYGATLRHGKLGWILEREVFLSLAARKTYVVETNLAVCKEENVFSLGSKKKNSFASGDSFVSHLNHYESKAD